MCKSLGFHYPVVGKTKLVICYIIMWYGLLNNFMCTFRFPLPRSWRFRFVILLLL
ncbi:hypothetical protein HanRHA438_Chr12g0545561 [Helianthus annuus]|nr:hypothetical protein HanRHA438_Chr12g0545561 [Helianthus annuus]